MEEIHHPRCTLDKKMDVTDDNHMEGMKMEIENKQTLDKDFSPKLSDETCQHLTFSEGPSSSCRRFRLRSRPKLQSTKSFPPYSQPIGGLGEDQDQDNELNSESSITHQHSLRQDDMMWEDGSELVQGKEKKEDFELNARCARDDVKAKWRMRRKERVWGSYEVDPDRWESVRWSGKRTVEGIEKERDHADKGREGCTNSERKHCRGINSSTEIERKEEEDQERKETPVSETEGQNEGKDEEADVLLGMRGGSTTPQRASPHPILSKLLQSSSSNSSCSSISLSSAESDEVFSEGEDAISKRQTFRKVRVTGRNTEWI